MAARSLSVLSLCAGGGALELGLDLALAGRGHPVAYVERDPFAAATLVARMEDASLGEAPVWDDLATFDGRPWRGLVDLVAAGFPCQPFSSAGQRLGLDDPRWLWPDVLRVVREVGPGLVFVENVRDLLVYPGALDTVLGTLADLGFDAEWSVLSAGAVGASQERKRFWLLAYTDDGRRSIERCFDVPNDGESPRRHDSHGRSSSELAPADGAGRGQSQRYPVAGAGCDPVGVREAVPGRCRGGLLFPPGRDDSDMPAWSRVLETAPDLEPSVCRMADGVAYRLDRLHVTGNGVVPLVAAAAFLGLARRAGLMMRQSGTLAKTPHSDSAHSASHVRGEPSSQWPESRVT